MVHFLVSFCLGSRVCERAVGSLHAFMAPRSSADSAMGGNGRSDVSAALQPKSSLTPRRSWASRVAAAVAVAVVRLRLKDRRRVVHSAFRSARWQPAAGRRLCSHDSATRVATAAALGPSSSMSLPHAEITSWPLNPPPESCFPACILLVLVKQQPWRR